MLFCLIVDKSMGSLSYSMKQARARRRWSHFNQKNCGEKAQLQQQLAHLCTPNRALLPDAHNNPTSLVAALNLASNSSNKKIRDLSPSNIESDNLEHQVKL